MEKLVFVSSANEFLVSVRMGPNVYVMVVLND